MIQHIVLWTFKEGVDKDATFAELEKGFASFTGTVPGLVAFKLYKGYQGYDVALVSVHESREALEQGYRQHPEHLKMQKVVAATREARASCDFEM